MSKYRSFRLQAEGEALPNDDPPAIANARPENDIERPLTFAVIKISRQYGLPIHLARIIAERAGLPAEVPYA